MSDAPLHSVSVAGVTFDESNRVLLVRRRDNGEWQAPGGILERDEGFHTGVVREVREETGIEVEVQRLTGVYKNMNAGVVALVYRCHAIAGRASPTTESAEVEWLPVEDAVRRMSPAFAVRVQDAARGHLAPPASRTHDGVNLL